MDLSREPRARQLVAAVENLATRVRMLPEEVAEADVPAALQAVGLINRDYEMLVKAYHEWDTAEFLGGAQEIIQAVRVDLPRVMSGPSATQVLAELTELLVPVAQGYYKLQQAWKPVSA